MDNIWLVNAAEKPVFSKKSRNSQRNQVKGRAEEFFFLEALGVVFAKEATTAMGDILAFLEASDLATEVLLLSDVAGTAGGGFEGFFFVISS